MESNLKFEVEFAIEIWKDLLLEKFQNELDYIYVKGSAVKQWKSKIDYVPQISDVDMHVKVKSGLDSELLHPSIETSRELSKEYEKRFKKYFTDLQQVPIHLPRMQLVFINRIIDNNLKFVFPRKKDVRIVYGRPIFPPEESHDYVRQDDKAALQTLQTTLEKIPVDLLDRSDYLEYYIILRRINYLVSPTPIRLLTQLLPTENPYDIWTWNRTNITSALRELSLNDTASVYEHYYLLAWELFDQNFQNTELFLQLLSTGLQVLQLVYNRSLTL